LAAWLGLAQEFEPLLRPLANAAGARALGGRAAGALDLRQARNGSLEQITWNATLCARCGYCLEGCPQYWGRRWEGQSPRGKWLNLRSGLPHTPEAAERFFACTLCDRCSQVCTVGIAHRDSWLALRSHLARHGLLPQPLATLRKRIGQQHNTAGLENTSRTAWSENLPESARAALHPEQADIVYFVGCLSGLYPAAYGIAQSLVQLLQRSGLRVATLGTEEWCCGLPLLAMGLPEEARALAEHNLEAVRRIGAGTLVVTCPSCLRAWRDDYPHLIGAKLGLQVRHAVELLPELLAQGALRLSPSPAVATYHDPCDLGRALGLYDQPRRLLQAIPGLTLREMADHGPLALCCGGGGDVEISDPTLVAAAADRRLRQALATGAHGGPGRQ
jgi:Fe-S oxidoreductase